MQDGAYLLPNHEILISVLNGFTNLDSVYSVYMVPEYITHNNYYDGTQESGYRYKQNQAQIITTTLTKPTTLDGYTPINKKLLTFPFCYINVSNNNGTSNILQYELFKSTSCTFKIKGLPTVGGSIKCIPLDYKVTDSDGIEEEGITGGKFPTLSWSADEYTNWLTQNGVNIGLGVASNLITIAGGLAMTGTGAGAIAGAGAVVQGGMGIANTLGQIYEHQLTPNSARGNTNSGDINSSTSTNKFYYYEMSIKQEYARVLDNFFSMYGYKVNDVKVPNITGRANWNYVKTIDCNITGEIPQEDLQELKDMFDNGVTFWHNPATFLDYSQSNSIVS